MKNYQTDYEYIASSKYFNATWYLKEYPDVAKNWKKEPEFHYLEKGWLEGRNPSPLFDGTRYLQLNRKRMKEKMNPLLHYEKEGRLNGIEAPATPYIIIKQSPLFDKKWYIKNYLSNEDSKKIDPVIHYLNIGWHKGYNPSPLFNGNAYLDRYDGVKKSGVCPLVHYERNGRREDRIIEPCKRPKYTEKGIMYRLLQTIILRIVSLTMNENIRSKKIVCFFHLFYPESWKEIKYYFRNLSIYDFHLVVSFPDHLADNPILEDIKQEYPDVEFYPCENRGFDIGPFFEMLKKIDIFEYDIVFKLHSKGITRPQLYMYGQYMIYKEWFHKLFRGTVGLINAHNAVKKLSTYEKIGMVAPADLIVSDPKHKFNLVNMWCDNLHVKKVEPYKYVAGTCFAVKSEALKSIVEMGLSITDFDVTTRGEFSLAHAMERIICARILEDGYTIVGNKVLMKKHRKEAAEREKYSPLRLLEDDRFIIDDNFFYRLVEGKQLEKYELIKMPIKDINRIWEGKKIKISECQPYRYLMGYTYEYFDYCDIHANSDLPLMTKQRFDSLISSIEEDGFDSKSVIVVNQDNILQDGQHRACYHCYKYGEDYEINVLKVYYRGQ